jgi:hypothetical protein
MNIFQRDDPSVVVQIELEHPMLCAFIYVYRDATPIISGKTCATFFHKFSCLKEKVTTLRGLRSLVNCVIYFHYAYHCHAIAIP